VVINAGIGDARSAARVVKVSSVADRSREQTFELFELEHAYATARIDSLSGGIRFAENLETAPVSPFAAV
jgi:hypothetical protein